MSAKIPEHFNFPVQRLTENSLIDDTQWQGCLQCLHIIMFSRKGASKYLKVLQLTHHILAKETGQIPWSIMLGMFLPELYGLMISLLSVKGAQNALSILKISLGFILLTIFSKISVRIQKYIFELMDEWMKKWVNEEYKSKHLRILCLLFFYIFYIYISIYFLYTYIFSLYIFLYMYFLYIFFLYFYIIFFLYFLYYWWKCGLFNWITSLSFQLLR